MVVAIKETTTRLYGVHLQKLDAYNQRPHNPCGYELIPDF